MCLVTKCGCPTLCDTMNCSPPGSSVYEISQARILEWVAISFSGESSQPRDWTHISYITGRFFIAELSAVSIYIFKYNLKSYYIVKMESFYLVWKQKRSPIKPLLFYIVLDFLSIYLGLKKKKLQRLERGGGTNHYW